jgi:hypothetical protein
MLQNDPSYLDEVHICPYCKEKMACCEAPPIHIGDGLGWGSEILFICLNNKCSLFVEGWKNIEERYGHHASYRHMELPGSKESNVMMVGNEDAFTGSVIDPQALKKQNERYMREQKAVKDLDTCLEQKNLEPVLSLILDEAANLSDRKKAISYLLELNNLSCIDPIRNHTFRDTSLEMACNQIIIQLLKVNYKKECPHCFEIIKAQAKKCPHCKETVKATLPLQNSK